MKPSDFLRTVKLGHGLFKVGPLGGTTPEFPRALFPLLKVPALLEESRESKSFYELTNHLKRATGQPSVELTLGTSGAFFQTGLALRDQFSNVVIETPFYEPYVKVLKTLGFSVNTFRRHHDFSRSFKDLRRKSSKRSILVISNPHFFHGYLQSKQEIEDCCELFGAVILDEVHLPQFSADNRLSLKIDAENVLSLSGFAKAFGLSNIRLGWASGPKKWIDSIADAGLLIQTDLPHANIHVGLKVFNQKDRILNAIKKQRTIAQRWIQNHTDEFELSHDFLHGHFASAPITQIKASAGMPSEIFGVKGQVRFRIDRDFRHLKAALKKRVGIAHVQ